MTQRALLAAVVLVFSIFAVGCDDDGTPPVGDGGGVADGALDTTLMGDAARADYVAPVTAPEAGWIQTEAGPVQVADGGELIIEDSGAAYICRETTCDGRLLECGDCKDNDGDGKIDFRDPECLGPCDNTEGPALESGVGGVIGEDCHVDCYFDYGNGMGQSFCWWDHMCDPLSPEEGCEYDQKMADNEHFCPATQTEECENYCIPFTPNGCDCFGCCTFPSLAGLGTAGADLYVWIGNIDESNLGTCTLDAVTDATKCPPCTPVDACMNTCARCEVCVGKPTVPADCFQPPPAPDGGVVVVPKNEAGVPFDGGVPADTGAPINPDQCPDGVQACGLAGQVDCPATYYCISGCCKKTIL